LNAGPIPNMWMCGSKETGSERAYPAVIKIFIAVPTAHLMMI